MFELVKMWALVEAMGLLCLPLTLIVFRHLPDRGWAFSKALGVTIFSFIVWLPLMCFQALPYNQIFLWGIALLLLVVGIAGFWLSRDTIKHFLRDKRTYLLLTEGIFLITIALSGVLRQFRPDIRSWEGLMDEGILAGIMRSPHFPPNDVWYAGYSINYYYYAHFVAATLGKMLGQSPSIVFNTGISLFFALTAVNLFGMSTNIVAWAKQAHPRLKANRSPQPQSSPQANSISPGTLLLRAAPFGLCSLAMGVLFGNLASASQWWVDIKTNVGIYDWFAPSRVITTIINGQAIPTTINEFPAFSFLLSDFHAHVLTLAFTVLAMGVAFNLFIGKGTLGLKVFGNGWQLPLTLLTSALVIGQLFVMNGWDYPTYLALALTCLALQQWLAHGSRFSRDLVLDVFAAGVALGALSYLLFLPFYINFLSPAQGLGLVDTQYHSPLNDEFLIFGLFAFIFVSFLLVCIFHLRSSPTRPASSNSQDTPAEDEDSKTGAAQPIAGSGWLKGRLIAVLVSLFVILGMALIFQNSATFIVAGGLCVIAATLTLYHLQDRARAFVLLLGAVALALIAFCEVIFLKDAFAGGVDFRMNTVFKFYYQAWMLFSVGSGSCLFFLIEAFWPGVSDVQHLPQKQKRSYQVRSVLAIPWAACLILLLLASLVYPVVAPSARLSTFNSQTNTMGMTPTWSLDGLTYLQTCQPPDMYPSMDSDSSAFCQYNVTHDYAAIRWINANIQGDPIIVEAANASNEDYSLYALVSSFTGLPTIMGWPGHEVQWRLNWLQNQANVASFNQRLTDINTIYTSPNPQIVLGLMRLYHAEYLYVGGIEHAAYPQVDLTRFASFMQTVYNQDGVAIYKLPTS